MYKSNKNIVVAIIAAFSMGITGGGAFAGGFLDIEYNDVPFGDPSPGGNPLFGDQLVIDNPYWPLRPDHSFLRRTFTYIGETEDECVIIQISVNDGDAGSTYLLTGDAPYGGTTAVQVVDIEWVFDDVDVCNLALLGEEDADEAIEEFTLDWYVQDIQQNIWYVGELSQNFEEEGCGEYPNLAVDPVNDPQCFEGSWEAGVDGGGVGEVVTGEAGIVVPGDFPLAGEPLENGNYFMQEVAFEAEDMAKIKRQHASLGEYEDCRKTKEWTALEPGASVEHKWYCADGPGAHGPGLVLIEGVGGGQTEVEELVSIFPAF